MSDLQNSDNQLEGFEEGPAIPPENSDPCPVYEHLPWPEKEKGPYG